MKSALTADLSNSQRTLLAIITKTNFLSNDLLDKPLFSEHFLDDLTYLSNKGLITLEKVLGRFNVSINSLLEIEFHLEFRKLPLSQRVQICTELANELESRGQIIEMLEILAESGDRRLFTNAITASAIRMKAIQTNERFLKLVDLMLVENTFDEFSAKSMKAAALIWQGEYLLAFSILDALKRTVDESEYASTLIPTIGLLRAAAYSYMGRPNAGIEEIEIFLSGFESAVFMNEESAMSACSIASSLALLCHDAQLADKAFTISQRNIPSTAGPLVEFVLLQIEATKYFIEGSLKKAYEKARAASQIANREGFEYHNRDNEVLYIQAMCEEEFLEAEKAIQTWQKVLTASETYRLHSWYCISLINLARCQNFLNPLVDINESITFARDYYDKLPYFTELECVVDFEELAHSMRTKDIGRARALLKQLPENPRSRLARRRLDLASDATQYDNGDEDRTTRQKIYSMLAHANNPKISDADLREVLIKAIALAKENGYWQLLVKQENRVSTMIVLLAAQEESSYRDELVAAIAWLNQKRTLSQIAERLDFTMREKEILTLLAASFSREEICEQLAILLNTLKTHQRHIYEKLGSKSRLEAVTSAQKLGILPR